MVQPIFGHFDITKTRPFIVIVHFMVAKTQRKNMIFPLFLLETEIRGTR